MTYGDNGARATPGPSGPGVDAVPLMTVKPLDVPARPREQLAELGSSLLGRHLSLAAGR